MNTVLIPLESGKFLNLIGADMVTSIGLNPFGVREVSKPAIQTVFTSFFVLIPLESGKFLNENQCYCCGQQQVLIPLESGKFLNFSGVVTEIRVKVLIPLESGKFLN